MSATRRLKGHALASVVQTAVAALGLFFLYRHIVGALGTEQLGLWSVLVATTSVARLSELGVSGGVTKFVATALAGADVRRACSLVETGFLTVVVVMGGIAVASYPVFSALLPFVIAPDWRLEAGRLLPWTLLSLWIGCASGVYLSALDGADSMTEKCYVLIGGTFVFVGLAVTLAPEMGLVGIAAAQVAQGLFVLVCAKIVLCRKLTGLTLLRLSWSKKALLEMLEYSIFFQANSLAALLFEPATKLLMARFGGLESAAHYEMASQLVLKIRSLLVAAQQSLVAAVARIRETAAPLGTLYGTAQKSTLIVSLGLFGALISTLDLISILWLGERQGDFIFFCILLSIAWFFNTQSGPAYFFNLGSGDIRRNTQAHVMTAVANGTLGVTLGVLFGSYGVLAALIVALTLGSVHLIHDVARRLGFSSANHLYGACGSLCLFVWASLVHAGAEHVASVIQAAAYFLSLWVLLMSLWLLRHGGVRNLVNS